MVATDKPAYPPWFEGNPENYSGFEGEIANEIAERMDLPIECVVEPFNKSYAPASKDYDFDISFINETIQPNEEPKIYDTTNDAKSALESGQVDAIVTDLVTTV